MIQEINYIIRKEEKYKSSQVTYEESTHDSKSKNKRVFAYFHC